MIPQMKIQGLLVSRASIDNWNKLNLFNSVIPHIKADLLKSVKQGMKDAEILSILPLVEIRVFDAAKKIKVAPQVESSKKSIQDTIIVPAQEEGFNDVFLGENCWYAIRIGGGKLKDIKYIAAYQSAPISAITHYAEVESIELYGDGGKYKLNFVAKAKAIGPIVFGHAKKGVLQSPRYSSHEKLLSAKELSDLFG